MVKKRVGGGKRYKAAAAHVSSKNLSEAEPSTAKTGPAPPKHLQRKIARKVGFLDKVAASSKALGVQAGITKKAGRKKAGSTLSNLNTLSGVLDEVQEEVKRAEASKSKQHQKAFGQGVNSGRGRAVIQATEAARLQQVLQHPVFKQNPIAAITNHLNSTLPAPAPPIKGKQQGGKSGKPGQGPPGSRAEIKRLARQRKKQQKADMDDS